MSESVNVVSCEYLRCATVTLLWCGNGVCKFAEGVFKFVEDVDVVHDNLNSDV